MSTRRGLFRLLLPVLSAFIAIGLVELLLIAFYPIPYSLERNMYFEADPKLGYRHRPLSTGYYPNGVTANANSLGFRDDEVAASKAPGTYRILTLGDSFTVGANVEQAEVYPQVLERLLIEALNRPVEIINAGVGGHDPFHYAQLVEHSAEELDPDMVLLGFFVGNDTYSAVHSVAETRTAVLGRRVARDTGKGWAVLLKVWGYENLNIVRALINRGPTSLKFNREQCDQFSPYYLAVQETRVENHVADPTSDQRDLMQANINELLRIKAWADQRSIPLLVILLPDEIQINRALQKILISDAELSNYDFDMPQKALHSALDKAGISYMDLLAAFRRDPRCLYMDDTHWIAAGHELAARLISEALQSGNRLH